MDTKNIILLISGFINLAMSVYIFSRGWKNKINLYFSLVTFFNFLWAMGLILTYAGISEGITRFFASFVYPVGFLIIVNLFYFIVYFPYPSFVLHTAIRWLINIVAIGYTIFCLFFYKVFVYRIDTPNPYFEPWSYILFSIILIILMISDIGILIYKYKRAEGIFRSQLLAILWAVVLGMSAGLYFNLWAGFIQVSDYYHLGPVFTLLLNLVVFYFIFIYKRFKRVG